MKIRDLILAGIFIFSFAVILLLAGAVAVAVESTSFINIVSVLVVLGIGLPLRFFYRNLEDIEHNLEIFFVDSRFKIYLTSFMIFLSILSFKYGISFPFSNILNLSFQASSQLFFPVKLLYSEKVGMGLGTILFGFGRFSLHLMWTYLISEVLTSIFRFFDTNESSGLHASVLPSLEEREGRQIDVYIVTGIHGFVRIPENYCKECHMFVNAAKSAKEEYEGEVDIRVRSYWLRFFSPLLKGGIHPPVLMVDGEVVAQGYDVPDKDDILKELRD